MKTTELKRPQFRNKKNFEMFLKEIDGMSDAEIQEIMGDDFIDTPGFYKKERKYYNNDIIEFMHQNMGASELERLREWWLTNVKSK
jgi:hypothetical protein